MNQFFKEKIFHPFLFAAFPVFFLYAENVNMVSVKQVLAPLGLLLIFTGALLLFSWTVLRSWHKAGLFASGCIILFFLYQPIFSLIQTSSVAGFFLTRHREVILILALLLAGYAFYLFRTISKFRAFTLVINFTALILLLPSFFKLIWFGLQPYASIIDTNPVSVKASENHSPDIYHFIMDAYGRQDVLKETYNYNNQPFLNALKKRGFYVAEKSTSNYYKTVHSIPSALNLNYLQNLIETKNLNNAKTISAKELVQKSKFRQILTANKFKYLCFSSGVYYTQIEDADEYFSPDVDLSELDYALINISPIPDLMQSFFPKDIFAIQRATVLYPFNHIKEAIRTPGSKFVQIHVLSPHPPFVFDQFGNSVQVRNHPDIYRDENFPTEILPADYYAQHQEHKIAYIDQLKFINKKLLQTIDTILAHSATPPVIIIQSDHGARLNCHTKNIEASNHFEAFANLSAFYFPDQDTAGVYQEISPVNIFRVIANKYFNGNFPLLPDKSYYSTDNEPYKFTEVTEAVKTKKIGPILSADQLKR